MKTAARVLIGFGLLTSALGACSVDQSGIRFLSDGEFQATGGTSGTAGTSGAAGESGAAGSGAQAGSSGAAGTSGEAGSSGMAGAAGTAGTAGSAGASGSAGMAGTAGMAGSGGMVVVPTNNIKQISAGDTHTCAVSLNGDLRCWGNGAKGRLGQGNTATIGDNELPSSLPKNVEIGGTVREIQTAAGHSCALMQTAAVRCFGANDTGALGYGNTLDVGDDEAPFTKGNVQFGSGSLNNPIGIAAGGLSACAIMQVTGSGSARCWGANDFGQLGKANQDIIGDTETLVGISNIFIGSGGVRQIAMGSKHVCVLRGDDSVICWGDGSFGKLGYANLNTLGDDELPNTSAISLGGKAKQIAAGGDHTCVLYDIGAVRCWGKGADGQLGYGNTDNIGDNEPPVAAMNVKLGGPIIQITAGENHTCALQDTGTVSCWGKNDKGQLGNGTTNNIGDDEDPTAVASLDFGAKVTQISAGKDSTCAVTENNEAFCWGSGELGKLGYGNTDYIGDDELATTASPLQVFPQ